VKIVLVANVRYDTFDKKKKESLELKIGRDNLVQIGYYNSILEWLFQDILWNCYNDGKIMGKKHTHTYIKSKHLRTPCVKTLKNLTLSAKMAFYFKID
jgi:hypothetical protein